jgi:hypothetical protein
MTQEEFDKLKERVRYLEELNLISHPAPESKELISDLEAKIGVNKPAWSIPATEFSGYIKKDESLTFEQEANVDEIELIRKIKYHFSEATLTPTQLEVILNEHGYSKQSPGVVALDKVEIENIMEDIANKYAVHINGYSMKLGCMDDKYIPMCAQAICQKFGTVVVTEEEIGSFLYKFFDSKTMWDTENVVTKEVAQAIVKYLKERK